LNKNWVIKRRRDKLLAERLLANYDVAELFFASMRCLGVVLGINCASTIALLTFGDHESYSSRFVAAFNRLMVLARAKGASS
jgi:hypothetical protein